MTRIEGFHDPVAHSAGTFPIRYPRSVMEGSRPFVKPMFLITPMNRLASDEVSSRARENGNLRASGVTCQRMPKKKRCASCNRGTHLRFEYGFSRNEGEIDALQWWRCRSCLTTDEKAALFMMLTEAEAGGLTD